MINDSPTLSGRQGGMSSTFPPTISPTPAPRSTTYRPSVWPGMPLPVPPVSDTGGAEVNGGSILMGGIGGSNPLPTEFILREALELDAGNLESAADLACEFGELFQTELKDLPDFHNDDPTPANIKLARDEEVVRLNCLPGELYCEEEVRLHFEALRFMGETWLAVQSTGGLEGLVAGYLTKKRIANRKANVNPFAWDNIPIEKIDSHEHMLRKLRMRWIERFEDLLDAGLSMFHLGTSSPEERTPTLYSVACLQLYNLIADGSPIKYCANETCRRGFVHQRGSAQYGQYHVTGVKYCQPSCGKAQNERERRRRRRRATQQ